VGEEEGRRDGRLVVQAGAPVAVAARADLEVEGALELCVESECRVGEGLREREREGRSLSLGREGNGREGGGWPVGESPMRFGDGKKKHNDGAHTLTLTHSPPLRSLPRPRTLTRSCSVPYRDARCLAMAAASFCFLFCQRRQRRRGLLPCCAHAHATHTRLVWRGTKDEGEAGRAVADVCQACAAGQHAIAALVAGQRKEFWPGRRSSPRFTPAKRKRKKQIHSLSLSLSYKTMAGPVEYAPSGRHPLLEAGYRVSGRVERERGREGRCGCSGTPAVAIAPPPPFFCVRGLWLDAPSRPDAPGRGDGSPRLSSRCGHRTKATAATWSLPFLSRAAAGVAARWATRPHTLPSHTPSTAPHAPQLGVHRLHPGRRHGRRAGEFSFSGQIGRGRGKRREDGAPAGTPARTTHHPPHTHTHKKKTQNPKGRRLRHQLGVEVEQQGQAVRGLRGGRHHRRRDGRRGRVKKWKGERGGQFFS
jgi:hypothetical protein